MAQAVAQSGLREKQRSKRYAILDRFGNASIEFDRSYFVSEQGE